MFLDQANLVIAKLISKQIARQQGSCLSIYCGLSVVECLLRLDCFTEDPLVIAVGLLYITQQKHYTFADLFFVNKQKFRKRCKFLLV